MDPNLRSSLKLRTIQLAVDPKESFRVIPIHSISNLKLKIRHEDYKLNNFQHFLKVTLSPGKLKKTTNTQSFKKCEDLMIKAISTSFSNRIGRDLEISTTPTPRLIKGQNLGVFRQRFYTPKIHDSLNNSNASSCLHKQNNNIKTVNKQKKKIMISKDRKKKLKTYLPKIDFLTGW